MERENNLDVLLFSCSSLILIVCSSLVNGLKVG